MPPLIDAAFAFVAADERFSCTPWLCHAFVFFRHDGATRAFLRRFATMIDSCLMMMPLTRHRVAARCYAAARHVDYEPALITPALPFAIRAIFHAAA